jgi:hypothetical protein
MHRRSLENWIIMSRLREGTLLGRRCMKLERSSAFMSLHGANMRKFLFLGVRGTRLIM